MQEVIEANDILESLEDTVGVAGRMCVHLLDQCYRYNQLCVFSVRLAVECDVLLKASDSA